MYLDKNAILGSVDLPREEVSVPEWGGKVLVRGLTAQERDALEESTVQRNSEGVVKVIYDNMRARLASLTIVDGDGNRIFTQADVEALGNKSGAALDRIFDVAQRLSGMTKKSKEVALKNSQTTQEGDSNIA